MGTDDKGFGALNPMRLSNSQNVLWTELNHRLIPNDCNTILQRTRLSQAFKQIKL